jgi:hypothetical protein
MKNSEARPYADPKRAARRIVEIASAVEPVQDGRLHVELINGPFLFKDKGSPAEYGAGIALAIERGWLTTHESCSVSHRPVLICSRSVSPHAVDVGFCHFSDLTCPAGDVCS